MGSAAAVKDSSLLPAAKQSSAVALLVFSMTDRAGFNQLPECQAELEPTPCIAIATKCDLVQSWSVTMVSCLHFLCCHLAHSASTTNEHSLFCEGGYRGSGQEQQAANIPFRHCIRIRRFRQDRHYKQCYLSEDVGNCGGKSVVTSFEQ